MIVWKKAIGVESDRPVILKLKITKGTKVYSYWIRHFVYNGKPIKNNNEKFRAERATVVEIQNCKNKKKSKEKQAKPYLQNGSPFRYTSGKIVKPECKFDMRRETCASGIHFFLSRRRAERY